MLAIIPTLFLFSGFAPSVSVVQSGNQFLGGATTAYATNNYQDMVILTMSWAGGSNAPIYSVSGSDGWALVSLSGTTTNNLVYSGGNYAPQSIKGILLKDGTISGAGLVLNFQTTTASGISSNCIGWVTNTLNYSSRTNLSYYMGKSFPVFSNTVYFSSSNSINTNCWVYGLNGMSAIPSVSQTAKGALVSPQHLITCWHAAPGTLAFLGTNGVVYSRTITNSLQVGQSDIRVCLLNAPLTNVETMSALGAVSSKFGTATISGGGTFPLISNQQDGSVVTVESTANNIGHISIPTWSNSWCQWVYTNSAGVSPFRAGDSGTPLMFVVSNRVYLAGTLFTSFYFSPVGSYTNQIQSAMNALSDSYGFSRYTLSVQNFNSYPNP